MSRQYNLAMETCANCGGMIGNLETPFAWNNRTVCATCYARLKHAAALAGDTLPYATPTKRRINRWWLVVAIGLAVVALCIVGLGFFAVSMTVVTPPTAAPATVSTPAPTLTTTTQPATLRDGQ
jgi:hypothetical protein